MARAKRLSDYKKRERKYPFTIQVKLEPSFHARVVAIAQQTGRSISSVGAQLIEEGLKSGTLGQEEQP